MGRFIFVSLGLLVVAVSLRGSGACCPCGWSSYDKYCYKVFDKRKNWDDAERFCMEQGKGGHLASLGSIEEGKFVGKLIFDRLKKHPTYVWVGLRAQGQGQQCSSRWSDGSRIVYENWHPLISRKCLVLSEWTGKSMGVRFQGGAVVRAQHRGLLQLPAGCSSAVHISPPAQGRLSLPSFPDYLKWYNHNCSFTFPFICKFLAEPDDDPE